MDATILAYFKDRLAAIERASMPHLARWTSLDRMFMGWAIGASEQPQDVPPCPSEYYNALAVEHTALMAFLLPLLEYGTAADIPARYKWSIELDAAYEVLLKAVETVQAIEGG